MAAQPTTAPRTAVPRVESDSAGTRLAGRRLLIARGIWAVVVAALVGVYLLLLPACVAQLRTVCGRAPCALVQPSPASAQTLQTMGFSVDAYAALTISLIIISSTICFMISGIIVWRKSDDWMALVVALGVVALGTELVPYLVQTGRSAWQLLALVTNALDFAVLFLVFALFPGGRFVPRWTRWLNVWWGAATVALVVTYSLTGELLFTAYTLVWLLVLSSVVGAQVYRYRMVSRPHERAQTRWVVFGGIVAVAVVITVFTPMFLVPALARPGSFYLLASAPIYALPIILFSICLAIAVLRHQLYDIDVIIRRTLIYTVVTGTLVTIYVLCEILLQAGFQAVTGQESALAVVGSTLVIATLFQPVRSRIQATIDRRFYRSKYDATRTVAAFGRMVRNDVDLA
jgi:hypothetical protein